MALRKPRETTTIGTHVTPLMLKVPLKARVDPEWDNGRACYVLKVSSQTTRANLDPRRRSNERALDEFLELGDTLERLGQPVKNLGEKREEDAERITAFVLKWGALGLCRKDALPCTHNWNRKHGERCSPCRSEPLEKWREFVASASEAITAAIRLQKDLPPSDAEAATLGLEMFHRLSPLDQRTTRMVDANERAELVFKTTRWWLDLSALRLMPTYGYEVGFGLDFEHGGRLFDLLAAQLLMAVAGAKMLALCAVCGRPFRVKQKRKPGQRTYCSLSACKKAANAMWVRESRYRARQLRGKVPARARSRDAARVE